MSTKLHTIFFKKQITTRKLDDFLLNDIESDGEEIEIKVEIPIDEDIDDDDIV